MSSKKSAVRVTRAASPAGPLSGPEAGQEATAASTPSTEAVSTVTLPVMETPQQRDVASPTSSAVRVFTPIETAPNSAEVASDAALQPLRPCNVATASMEELQT